MADQPFDIMNLHLHVPTVKGAARKAPSYMVFEVTSETQDSVEPMLARIRTLIAEASLVLVAANVVGA